MNRCPACGQIIPPEIGLGPIKQRIYKLLQQAPRTAEQLRELLWGDRGINHATVYVHIHGLNVMLRPHGLAVRCVWRGPYYLVSIG